MRLGRVLQDEIIVSAKHVVGQNPKVGQNKGDQHKHQHAIDDKQGRVEGREVGKVSARAVGNRAPQQCPERERKARKQAEKRAIDGLLPGANRLFEELARHD
jgi:hypothetical protein